MFYKKNSHMGACLALHILVAVLLFVVAVAAAIGVYHAHVLSSGDVFGTMRSSLAILAFSVAVTLWMKQLKCCVTKCEACNGK